MAKKIGLALGGGGAKGLAHILMLEVFDELRVEPHLIAGTSIGAVVGVLYASGRSGRWIRRRVEQLLPATKQPIRQAIASKKVLQWAELLALEFGRRGLLKVDNFLSALAADVRVTTFERLRRPLKIVAADFWRREQVVFDSGALMPAVRASMALPGIFAPAEVGGRVLVDGGTINPVPYDLLLDECDVTVAVNVMGRRADSADAVPALADAVFGAFQIMQRAILNEKLRHRPPTIYIEPDVVGVRVLDFHKARAVFEQAKEAKARLKQQLAAVLEE